MGEHRMEYEISIAENCMYIRIKYFAPMTTELAFKSGPELNRLAAENGIRRFLFDMQESSNVQSVTDNYFFANQHLPNMDFPKDSRSAFLIPPLDHSHDFITMAFQNAGYTVAKFSAEAEAISWLCADLEGE